MCLTDIFDDGLSLVYSFFDTSQPQNSIGTYMILNHIDMAREAGLPYVYLGYWVPGSPKMDYKARFKGVEIFRDGRWRQLDLEDDFSRDKNLCEIKSISEQVAHIAMPEMTHSHET